MRMAFVHEQSCEFLKSELDLLSVPSTQNNVDRMPSVVVDG